jgi:hypothetical protein
MLKYDDRQSAGACRDAKLSAGGCCLSVGITFQELRVSRVSVSIAWSSVRAAKSFEAGSAIAKDAAALEIDSTAIRLGPRICLAVEPA